MVLHGLLPAPLPSDLIVIGQLLTHPLHPSTRPTFYSHTAHADLDDLIDAHIQLRYRDILSVDTSGRFAAAYGAKFDLGRVYRQPHLLSVRAEQMIQRTAQEKGKAFEAVVADPEAREWIAEQVRAGEDLYIVLGTTELRNATFARARLHDAGASSRLLESPIAPGEKVGTVLRGRAGSLAGVGSARPLSGVFGLSVHRVVARLSTPAEPHDPSDLGFKWLYYDLVPPSTSNNTPTITTTTPASSTASPTPPISSSGTQLMLGLGPSLPPASLREMLDLTEEDVQGNLDAISKLSLDALSAAASPLLRPSSPALRGRSPSPRPGMLG